MSATIFFCDHERGVKTKQWQARLLRRKGEDNCKSVFYGSEESRERREMRTEREERESDDIFLPASQKIPLLSYCRDYE
jgi:gamma-glutamyl-gamma-aminobutyrate hydrolase PuuD